MNEIIKARHEALTQALVTNLKKVSATQKLDFSIMEQEFIKQGYREDSPSGVENILIFRLDAMGDFILSTPAIREIRANYPYAFITLLVNKAVYSMAEFCPYVNEVIAVDVKYSGCWDWDFQTTITTAYNIAVKHLWKRQYSLCICLRHSIYLIDLLLNYLSGAKKRVGHIMDKYFPYVGDPNQKIVDLACYFLTNPIVHPKEVIHTCARNLYLLQAMGLHIHRTDCELWYDAEDLYNARNLLEGFAPERLKIVVGIGANLPAQKYPVEKYLVAFKEIISKGASIIILGGPNEVDDAKFLEDNLPKEYVLNGAVKNFDWRISAAITSLCDMYIGNDTGTMHIAAAAKIYVIGLSREPKGLDKSMLFKGVFSCYNLFFPWQANAIVLRPKQPLEECRDKFIYSGCSVLDKPHCITQIDPSEIVDVYETFAKLIKNSFIKRTSCPPIINSINPLPKLRSDLIHP